MKRCLLLILMVVFAGAVDARAQPDETVRHACMDDAQRLCGTLAGKQRRACMKRHRAELSSGCRGAINAKRQDRPMTRTSEAAQHKGGASCERRCTRRCHMAGGSMINGCMSRCLPACYLKHPGMRQ